MLIAAGAIVVLFIVVFLSLLTPDKEAPPELRVRMPELILQPLMNATETVTLDDLEGEVVLLNFWGTWCPPCRLEFPHIAKLNAELGHRDDFSVLAVSCGGSMPEDANQLRENSKAFLREMNVQMPIYQDRDAATRRALQSADGFPGYPTTYIIDRDGYIRGMWSGFAPGVEGEMRELVGRLLQEPRKMGKTPHPPTLAPGYRRGKQYIDSAV